MVSFICDACGNTVKKNQVEKHYQVQCRSCSVLSCIDCGVDFPGEAYVSHTSCITEAEKYQGHLYQPKDKENKGEAKQKEWVKQVQNAGGNVRDPKIKSLLQRISEYSNIPRKKKKFENFCKNSVKVYDDKTLNALWDAFNIDTKIKDDSISDINDANDGDKNNRNTDSDIMITKKKKKRKLIENNMQPSEEINKKKKKKKDKSTEELEEEEVEEEEEEIEDIKRKFNWHKTIKFVLKQSEDHQLPVKKLRKKVLSAYQEHGIDHRTNTVEESRALFEKKLKSYPKVKLKKEIATLIK